MNILDTLITDRTDGATYNVSDFLRVTEAVEYVAVRLRSCGYEVPVFPKKDWDRDTRPTLSVMKKYVDDIEKLRETLSAFAATPETPRFSEEKDYMTVQEANNIEKILLDVEAVIKLVIASYRRCGQFTGRCGTTLPLPVQGGTPPRTWDELDTLGWGWDVWDQLTWQQLLYEEVSV